MLSKSQRIGTNPKYWEDFPEAVNNVPEAEEKLQIDPNLALITVVPKHWISVLKCKVLLSHLSHSKITERWKMHFSQNYAVMIHSVSQDELANILYIILILIHNTLHVKMRKSRTLVRHLTSCLLIERVRLCLIR